MKTDLSFEMKRVSYISRTVQLFKPDSAGTNILKKAPVTKTSQNFNSFGVGQDIVFSSWVNLGKSVFFWQTYRRSNIIIVFFLFPYFILIFFLYFIFILSCNWVKPMENIIISVTNRTLLCVWIVGSYVYTSIYHWNICKTVDDAVQQCSLPSLPVVL